MELSEKDIKRFWENVIKHGDNECWGWKLKYTDKGYGTLSVRQSAEKAHRISFFIEYGYISEDIHHTCRNRGCCNPRHLITLTHGEHTKLTNAERPRESFKVGDKHIWRVHPELIKRGEKHLMAKLTQTKVNKIRRLRKKGLSCRVIGKMFDISGVQVSNIVTGKQWKESYKE